MASIEELMAKAKEQTETDPEEEKTQREATKKVSGNSEKNRDVWITFAADRQTKEEIKLLARYYQTTTSTLLYTWVRQLIESQKVEMYRQRTQEQGGYKGDIQALEGLLDRKE